MRPSSIRFQNVKQNENGSLTASYQSDAVKEPTPPQPILPVKSSSDSSARLSHFEN